LTGVAARSNAGLANVCRVVPTARAAPVVDDAGVTFHLPDPPGRLDAVRLVPEPGLGGIREFTRRGGRWSLRLRRPPVDRMEYLFEIVDRNAHPVTITDPANPLRAGGPFGDKSEVRFPGYLEPAWRHLPETPGSTQPFSIATTYTSITGLLWSPTSLAAAEPAPLLVVHDGPEYATLGSFTQYLGAMIAAGTLPALRAVLLSPGDRNAWYSANPAYTAALCTEVLPALDRPAPSTVRIGVGVSLGALAMLHAHWTHPTVFDGLLLQSGSFFTPKLDPQEAGFVGFGPVTNFVAGVEQAARANRPVPTAVTCGGAEENCANNLAMAAALTRLGYPVESHHRRDAHNYTAWRDALDPACTRLLTCLVDTHAQ
jgi:enterochelin esterase-like enzyme